MRGFTDHVDEALRVIGRLVALAIASLLTLFLQGIALKPLLPDGLPTGREGTLILAVLIAFALAVGHVFAGIVFEHGRWEPTGLGPLAWRPLALLTGSLLGAVAVAVPAVVLIVTHAVDIVPMPGEGWSAYAGQAMAMVAASSLVLELCLRGYAFGLIAERWGAAAALVLTSVVAAAIHLRLPSATAVSFVGVVALSGCLGAIRLRTESVATSWLAHFAFASTQLALLHGPLRGTDLPSPPGYVLVAVGPTWLTGGENGVAAGAAVAASLAVVTFLVLRARPANAGQARE